MDNETDKPRFVTVACGNEKWNVDTSLFTRMIRIPCGKRMQDNDMGVLREESLTEEEQILNENECRSLFFRALFRGGFREQNEDRVTIQFQPRILANVDESNWPESLNRLVLQTHRPEWHVGAFLNYCSGATIDEIIAPFQGDDASDKSCAISVAVSLIGTAQYFVSLPMLRSLQYFIIKCCEQSWQARKEQQQKEGNSGRSQIIDTDQTCTLWTIANSLQCPILQSYCRSLFSIWREYNVFNCMARNGRPKRLQLAFLIDTTGSMGACLGQLRVKVRQLLETINERGLANYIEWAAISFGDYCDACQIRTVGFTQEGADVSRFISLLCAAGGGPTPEAYEWGLDTARTTLAWRAAPLNPSSVTGEMPSSRQNDDCDCVKVLVVVGDSFPHCPSYTTSKLHWKDEVDKLLQEGIVVCSIAAAGSSTAATVFMREVARRGKGIYVDMGSTLQYKTLSQSPHKWDMLEDTLLDCLQNCKENSEADSELDLEPERMFSYAMKEVSAEAIDKRTLQEYAEEIKEVENEEWWKFGSEQDDTEMNANNTSSRSSQPAFSYTPSLRIWERVH